MYKLLSFMIFKIILIFQLDYLCFTIYNRENNNTFLMMKIKFGKIKKPK